MAHVNDNEPVRVDNMQANRGGDTAGIALGIAFAIAFITFVILYGSGMTGQSIHNLGQKMDQQRTDVTGALPGAEKSSSN